MKYIRSILTVALVIGICCAPLFAQSKDAPLTDKELAKLIADWPAVYQWLEAKGQQLDEAEESGPAAFAAMAAVSGFEAFLRGKGWTVERFSYVAGTTFMLTAYLTMEKENPDMIKEMDEAIAQTRANASLSPSEKAQQIQALEEAKKGMLAMPAEAKLNEAEMKLVRARYDALYKIMEESNN